MHATSEARGRTRGWAGWGASKVHRRQDQCVRRRTSSRGSSGPGGTRITPRRRRRSPAAPGLRWPPRGARRGGAKERSVRQADRRSHALLDRRCCPILTAAPTLRWDMDLDALRPELPPHPRLGPRLRRAAQGRDPRDEPGAGRADAHRAPGAVRGCAATGARGDAGAGWGGGDLTDGALAQARRAPATR